MFSARPNAKPWSVRSRKCIGQLLEEVCSPHFILPKRRDPAVSSRAEKNHRNHLAL
jgi:hypothetical protein